MIVVITGSKQSHSHTGREGMGSREQVFKVDRRISDLTSLSDNFSNVDSNVFEFAVSVTELDVTSESEASDVTSESEASLTTFC